MPLKTIIPLRQPQGSLLYRLLLRLHAGFAWVAVPLLLALGAAGAAAGYFAWQLRYWPLAVAAVLALLGMVALMLLWSEYDWWLFKLGPRKQPNLPIR
ncbi:hypothetical protein NK553_04685 [Pseudomonas sp. ZM23]|uniref:Uncharacterized protein n=1 Tax=Pseudomonas triclosanedens TaxID=2961893 RepID=A0ABY6ZUR9_9PSED|nr:hypothetical protein [Pseudomonas triclosanedens]MCP8463240.1 hypothetical protein [Pseudomonas triclosanedens]MCP8469701.1 hypothetical protein [Pseudomonas triclosanedens]MCP8474041.1 hypothetical protein [Pseudomonas triclosanedens]WAI48561.1 hypothetical protein OU419_22810 [Pseudomonas triclosanedens]